MAGPAAQTKAVHVASAEANFLLKGVFMARYQYKVVPFIGKLDQRGRAEDVADQLQGLINNYTERGWIFHQLADVNIEIKPGCLGVLFGAKAGYVRYDQLIFRREIQ